MGSRHKRVALHNWSLVLKYVGPERVPHHWTVLHNLAWQKLPPPEKHLGHRGFVCSVNSKAILAQTNGSL